MKVIKTEITQYEHYCSQLASILTVVEIITRSTLTVSLYGILTRTDVDQTH